MTEATLEAGLFRHQFDDGLIDVLAGGAALCVGIGWMTNLPILAAVAPVVFAGLWPGLRKFLITPRLGQVAFTATQTGKMRKGKAALAILFTLSALMAVVAFGAFEGWLGPLNAIPANAYLMVPGLVIGLAAFLVFLFVGLQRFLVYGAAFIAASGYIHLATDQGPGADLALAALAPFGLGLVLLIRFLTASAQSPD